MPPMITRHPHPRPRRHRLAQRLSRRATSALCLAGIFSLNLAPAYAQDDHLARFNAVAQRAEAALQRDGAEAAIRIYEEALLDDNLGRIHLRLGQLLQDQGRLPEAAYHYQACAEDDRVDPLDRNIICRKGIEATTTVLKIDGLPRGGRVIVQQPEGFVGPVDSGVRLPRGSITVVVEAPGRAPQISTFPLKGGEYRWQAVIGAPTGDEVPVTVADAPEPSGDLSPKHDEVEIPDGFISSEPVITQTPPPADDQPWGIYATGGVGLALLGTGLYLGVNNQDDLDDIRRRQRIGACGLNNCSDDLDQSQSTAQVADALWITGAAVVTTAVIWYLLDD